MNRMKVILELADVQIFLQMNNTPQVEFEMDYAKSVSRHGRAPALSVNFSIRRRRPDSRAYRPVELWIRDGRGRDRFSNWRRRSVVYTGGLPPAENFTCRFAEMVDLCLKSRKRTILRWNRCEQWMKRRIERFSAWFIEVFLKWAERKAKKDPAILQRMGGSIEAGREKFRTEIAKRPRSSRTIGQILIRQSGLAEIVARNPTALDAYVELTSGDLDKVVQENEIETYLLGIRRGEAEFHQSFAQTYADQKMTLQASQSDR